jgi:hypothetical protein
MPTIPAPSDPMPRRSGPRPPRGKWKDYVVWLDEHVAAWSSAKNAWEKNNPRVGDERRNPQFGLISLEKLLGLKRAATKKWLHRYRKDKCQYGRAPGRPADLRKWGWYVSLDGQAKRHFAGRAFSSSAFAVFCRSKGHSISSRTARRLLQIYGSPTLYQQRRSKKKLGKRRVG